jgi:predicted PurR-regulated permease PerM
VHTSRRQGRTNLARNSELRGQVLAGSVRNSTSAGRRVKWGSPLCYQRFGAYLCNKMSQAVQPRKLATQAWTLGLNLAALGLILFTLYQTREIIAWMLIALLFALALEPAVELLERRGISRGLGIASIFLGLAGLVALLFWTVLPVFVEQGHHMIESAPQLLEKVRAHPSLQWVDGKFNILDPLKDEWSKYAKAAALPLLKMARGLFGGVLGGISILVLTLFMLASGSRLFHGALEWVHPAERPRYVALSVKIRRSVGRYMLGTLLIGCLGGLVTGTTMAILGVPFFLPLGMLMILLGLVPFLGAALGGTLIVGTTFLTAGAKAGAIALGVFMVYQQAENHILQPIVQRKTIEMNPLLIVMVMLIGTGIAGIVGAVLSLPIAAAAQIVLQDVLARRQARLRSELEGEAASPEGQASTEGL